MAAIFWPTVLPAPLPLMLLLLAGALADAGVVSRASSKEQRVNRVMRLMELAGDEEASSAVYMPGEQLPVNMPPEHMFFRDFCIGAQDEIKADVRRRMKGAAMNLYALMLTWAADTGAQVLQAHAQAVPGAVQVIKEAAPARDARSPDDIDENAEQALDQVAAQPTLLQRVGSDTRQVINVIIETARSTLFHRIVEFKVKLGTNQLRAQIEQACAAVRAELLPKVSRRLDSAKQSLLQELSGSQMLGKVRAANPNTVGCTLSGRVWRVAKLCDVLEATGPAVYALAGIH